MNQNKERRELPLIVLEFGQVVCWFFFIACLCAATGFCLAHWVGGWAMPTGVIGLSTLGATIFLVTAHSIRAAIHHRQLLALAEDIRAELRHDIRDHAPADTIELARIAALMQQVTIAQGKLADRMAVIERYLCGHSIRIPTPNTPEEDSKQPPRDLGELVDMAEFFNLGAELERRKHIDPSTQD